MNFDSFPCKRLIDLDQHSMNVKYLHFNRKAPDCGRLSFEMFPWFVAWLSVRGGWEATRFPVGERRASSDCVLRDLAYLLLPRESRSFPTTPFHVREKRPLYQVGLSPHYPIDRSMKRFVSSLYVLWSGLYDPLLQL